MGFDLNMYTVKYSIVKKGERGEKEGEVYTTYMYI